MKRIYHMKAKKDCVSLFYTFVHFEKGRLYSYEGVMFNSKGSVVIIREKKVGLKY